MLQTPTESLSVIRGISARMFLFFIFIIRVFIVLQAKVLVASIIKRIFY